MTKRCVGVLVMMIYGFNPVVTLGPACTQWWYKNTITRSSIRPRVSFCSSTVFCWAYVVSDRSLVCFSGRWVVTGKIFCVLSFDWKELDHKLVIRSDCHAGPCPVKTLFRWPQLEFSTRSSPTSYERLDVYTRELGSFFFLFVSP